MTLCIQISREQEDILLQVNGSVVGHTSGDLYTVKDGYVAVRVDRILYAVESGAKVHLSWQGSGDHIITLEGRGIIDAEKFGGLVNPRSPGWLGGIALDAEGPQSMAFFTLMLDLYKQRS